MGQYNQNFPDYGTQASSSFEAPPAPDNSRRTILIVVAVLLVVCCLCVICPLVFYFFLGDILTDALDITQWITPVLSL